MHPGPSIGRPTPSNIKGHSASIPSKWTSLYPSVPCQLAGIWQQTRMVILGWQYTEFLLCRLRENGLLKVIEDMDLVKNGRTLVLPPPHITRTRGYVLYQCVKPMSHFTRDKLTLGPNRIPPHKPPLGVGQPNFRNQEEVHFYFVYFLILKYYSFYLFLETNFCVFI